jgi:Tol biopolymer transport system component
MQNRFSLKLVVLLTLPAALALAADPAPPKRVMTAEDLWAVKRPAALDLSPDGSRLVFAVKEYNLEKNNSVSHLWLLDTASGASHPLTTADSTDENPTWSPDGRTIAFTSKRGADKVAALYLIHPDGGEAEKVVELPLAVSTPRWLSGTRIVLATEVLPKLAGDLEAEKAELKQKEESKVTAKVTEDGAYRFFDT